MKKDRNCTGVNPYMMYNGMMPMGPMPMAMPSYTNYSVDINTLQNQVNALEQRVSNLENMINKNYSTNYNASNYQMM